MTETTPFIIDNGYETWKIYIQSFRTHSLLLRIINEHDSSKFFPSIAALPSVIDCNDGRSIHIISFIHSILSIIVDEDS